MTIITINTTPIPQFLSDWANAIGYDGFVIIGLCVIAYMGICFVQIEMERKERAREFDKIKKEHYY